MRKSKIKKEREKGRRGSRSVLSAEELLLMMEEADRPLLLREILRRLGLQKEQRQKAREYLKDLADQGKVVRIRGNRYGLPSKMNLIVGRVKTHQMDMGLLSQKQKEKKIFSWAPETSKRRWHGDRVVARIESIRKKGKRRQRY